MNSEEAMEQCICYCFGYTQADIVRDCQQHGTSTLLAQIMAAKQAGGCQCAIKNPSGR